MKNEINEAVKVLKAGGVILYPTDTIWGLGCDPYNEQAVKKIFDIKQRASDKALIVLISNFGQLYDIVEEVPEIAEDIIEYTEKALTVIYPKGKRVSASMLPEDKSIAIRLVKKGLCFELLRAWGKPLTSTSANISGEPTAALFQDIKQEIIDQCDYVFPKALATENNTKPSTIIKLGLSGEYKVIRD